MAEKPESNSTDEIEITAEMIEAGVEEYHSHVPILRNAIDDGPAANMVEAVYRVMALKRQQL